MKILLKKLKKNQLLSKIAALFTICMILLSSFTVSSFAADEDESTNSITEVWTGVTDSIMSLLGTAQGVFVSSGFVPFDVSAIGDTGFGVVTNLPSLSAGDTITFVGIDGESVREVTLTVYPSSSFSNTVGVSFDLALALEDSEGYIAPVLFYNAVYSIPGAPSDLVSGWSSDISLFDMMSGYYSSGGLTFLGTLAVIGVALALILLLVFVISRFIHLRG